MTKMLLLQDGSEDDVMMKGTGKPAGKKGKGKKGSEIPEVPSSASASESCYSLVFFGVLF